MSITFTYKGEQYTGELSQVQGAAGTGVYHLMIDNYYRGCLRLSAFDNCWVFDGEFADLAEGLGMWTHVLDWIKSELEENKEELFYYLTDSS
jgi:hypothetical protein